MKTVDSVHLQRDRSYARELLLPAGNSISLPGLQGTTYATMCTCAQGMKLFGFARWICRVHYVDGDP